MCTGTHPFIPAEETAQVALRALQDGQQIEHVFYVKAAAPLVPGDLSEIALAVSDWFTDHYAPLLVSTVTGVEVVVTDWSTDAGPRVVSRDIAGIAGGDGTLPAPNNVSFKIAFSAGVRGAHAGGPFVYGLPANKIDASTLDVTLANDLVNAWVLLGTDLLALDYQLVVVQNCEDNAWLTIALVHPIAGITYTDLVVDSQRRRLPGRGR